MPRTSLETRIVPATGETLLARMNIPVEAMEVGRSTISSVAQYRRCKHPVCRVVDQVLVVGVYICDRDVGVRPELPVVRVVCPDDRDKPEPVSDATDTVVDVTIWRLYTSQRTDTNKPAELSAHPPAGRRDAGDELDGLHLLYLGRECEVLG